MRTAIKNSDVLVWPMDIPFERKRVVRYSGLGMPFWRDETIGMPQLGHYKPLLDAVFFLYRSQEEARKGVGFGGTGFAISIPTKRWPDQRSHGYAVTNWHVAVRDGFSVIRLNTKDGATDTIPFGPENWVFRPHWHDVAIAPLPTADNHRITVLAENFFLPPALEPQLDIGVGDDVFMVGRFVDYEGHQTNKPAARFGHISMVEAPILQSTGYFGSSLVIDLHSRSGFSGSPVFVYRTPGSYFARPPVGGPLQVMMATHMMYLLGIHWGQFPEQWELKDKPRRDVVREASMITDGKYVEGLSGMTCVCPASAIRELLNDPRLVAHREADELELEAKLGASGSVPRAEAESQPPTTDENPSHKEDFTRLLGAAVKQPRPDGQT